MPKISDVRKILVIGSGPIAIGQGPEFDYAGTQACIALKEEGFEVVLVNSNPATIMTDKEVADIVYMEPITLKYVSNIIYKERPCAVIATLGGQTGLNMLMQLDDSGILKELNVKILSTDIKAIKMAEDREEFKKLCQSIGEPVIESEIANTVEQAKVIAQKIGFPVVLRPAYTLGGTGSNFCDDLDELLVNASLAIDLSPTAQVLVEKSIKGYKEIEYEVIRDNNNTTIVVCNMENIDAVGVHTGDSVVVAPVQTLTNNEVQMLRDSAKNIVNNLNIIGGCNAQYALDPHSEKYYIIEVNPRVSRSSALASKATGYPIAYVSAKIAIGLRLDEIKLPNTMACFEPAIDYVVSKFPRFAFDKFSEVDNTLFTQMKATGEIMSIGRTFEESFLKGYRSLENQKYYFDYKNETDMLLKIKTPTDDRFDYIYSLLKDGVDPKLISKASFIDYFFIMKLKNIVDVENSINSLKDVYNCKKIGLSDAVIANCLSISEKEVREYRYENNINAVYKMVDSCASEFDSTINYYYSTYFEECEVEKNNSDSVIVIGSGPNRIGQGIEFDYSTVHAIKTIKDLGLKAIVINSNPGTVSTDYMLSDKLYFEPLTLEEVLNVYNKEKPLGVIVQLGGQTPINLVEDLDKCGVNILGTSVENINRAEDRNLFEDMLNKLNVRQPKGATILDVQTGINVCEQLGFPVIIRPSFVLGGRAMKIVYSKSEAIEQINIALKISMNKPILIDKYMVGKEVEVDAVSDGISVFIPGIMEHIEKTGVHSGDSIVVYPSFSLSKNVSDQVINITEKIGLELKIIGMFNIQFIVTDNEEVFIIEVNPRSSRSVPFISKITNTNLARIATKAMLGEKLNLELYLKERRDKYFVKVPTFSFSKLDGVDTIQSPEMKSTGEVIGYETTMNKALYKGLIASGQDLDTYGTVFLTVSDDYKNHALKVAKRFKDLGFDFVCTQNTAQYLSKNNINVKIVKKISEDASEITNLIKNSNIKYVLNIGIESSVNAIKDGQYIRSLSAKYNIYTLTSIDTMNALLNVLEERHEKVSEI